MNERIRELAEQCTDRHFNEGGGFETFDKEKFAELIVRKCAQFADNSPQYVGGREILEHFGVEES
jgi:hypothetical protein